MWVFVWFLFHYLLLHTNVLLITCESRMFNFFRPSRGRSVCHYATSINTIEWGLLFSNKCVNDSMQTIITQYSWSWMSPKPQVQNQVFHPRGYCLKVIVVQRGSSITLITMHFFSNNHQRYCQLEHPRHHAKHHWNIAKGTTDPRDE